MSWFEKLMPRRIRTEGGAKKAVPEGLWTKCPGCGAILYRAEMERTRRLSKCGFHNRVTQPRLDCFSIRAREEIGPISSRSIR